MASTPGETPATSTEPTVTLPSSTATEEQPSSTAQESTTAEQPTTSTSADPTTSTTSAEPTSTTAEEPTSTTSTSQEPSTTSTTSEEPTSTSAQPESSTTEEPTTTQEPEKTTILVTQTSASDGSTAVVVITQTTSQVPSSATGSSTATSSSDPTLYNPSSGNSSGGLSSGAKIAMGVAIPIGAIAILAVLGLFWWKKRKARHEAEEEERRKEVEDYSYNPNGPGGPFGSEMREDSLAGGYRGWGTTTLAGGAAGSMGRKGSTTMSGTGMTYSDAASPKPGHASVDWGSGSAGGAHGHSPSEGYYAPPHHPGGSEGEILGAMGPAAANNRSANQGVNRGPSNASSSYSAAAQSDNSDGTGSYPAAGAYYDAPLVGGAAHHQHSGSGSTAATSGVGVAYSQPQELPAQPVIRDNPARRNTRIENPAHYPQQSAGISQNF